MHFISFTLPLLYAAVVSAVSLPSNSTTPSIVVETPSTTPGFVVKKRQWIPTETWYTANATEGELWPKGTEMKNFAGCTTFGCFVPWWLVNHYPIPEEGNHDCPKVTIGEQADNLVQWIGISNDFLRRHGSLRKACGKNVTIRNPVTGTTTIAQIRRSCEASVCPGENAITVSHITADKLRRPEDGFTVISDQLVDGMTLEWKLNDE